MVKDKATTPDKIKFNSKLQVQKYIESFFVGKNKKYMNIASPATLSYDISHSTIEGQNVKEKKLQIARYFNELKNYLPAILILDGSMRNVPQSFNNTTNVFGTFAKPEVELSPIREMEIGILVGSNDVQTTDDLITAISLMFNEFRTIGGGNLIVGDPNKGESWAICLPLAGINFGSIQEQAINGDSVDKIHYCEASVTLFYEDKIRFSYDSEIKFVSSKKASPKLEVPSKINVNEQIQVKVTNYNPEMRIVIDNYRLATLSPRGILTPRSFGKFKIKILGKRDEILDEKEIEII